MMATQEGINQAILTALQRSMPVIVSETTKAVKRSIQDDVEGVVEKKVKQEETPNFRRKYNADQ